jgi:hypothetical protein
MEMKGRVIIMIKLTRYNNKCTNSIFHPSKYFIVSELLMIICKQEKEKIRENELNSM